MCAGCGVPCGGECGTGDWEKVSTEDYWVTCSNPECEFEDDVEGELETSGRGNIGSAIFCWICPTCGLSQEVKVEPQDNSDFDPPDDNNYYY